MRSTEAPDFDYIKVGLTDGNVEECIEIELTGPGQHRRAHLRLHTTEAIDLQRKLSNALTDWLAESAAFFTSEGRSPESRQ
jgi:hypothetical protein